MWFVILSIPTHVADSGRDPRGGGHQQVTAKALICCSSYWDVMFPKISLCNPHRVKEKWKCEINEKFYYCVHRRRNSTSTGAVQCELICEMVKLERVLNKYYTWDVEQSLEVWMRSAFFRIVGFLRCFDCVIVSFSLLSCCSLVPLGW